MKSIALERHFSGYSFFAVEKRVTGSKGPESKMARMPVSVSACFMLRNIRNSNI
ncbi:hypothetical protein GPSY_4181 [Paraglaciecola psychrophila 170]|nr:hypothetical protein GPSY_4181 [Paraglaciecola psychrophila 170]